MNNKEQINQLINGVALFDKQVIKKKCLKVKATLKKVREKKLKEAKENQKSHADLFRKDYYLKSFWYRLRLKWGRIEDVNQMSDKDLITQYKNDIRSISTYKEVGRLIDLWYEDKEAISYKRDTEKLCDELVSVCDALKGDEIWISSQAWSKLNEKI
jgi:hypothetical protein